MFGMNKNQRSEYRLLLLSKNPRCSYCNTAVNETDSSLDHVVPQCHGGTHTKNNMVLSCQSCNSRKGNKSWNQWLKEIGRSRAWGIRFRKNLEKLGGDYVADVLEDMIENERNRFRRQKLVMALICGGFLLGSVIERIGPIRLVPVFLSLLTYVVLSRLNSISIIDRISELTKQAK